MSGASPTCMEPTIGFTSTAQDLTAELFSNRAVLVTPRDRLSEFVGSNNPIRVDLAAATEALTTGAVRLVPGQWSEPIEYPAGDKVVFVTGGTLHVRVWNTEEWYELGPTDTCFLPKGTTHSFVN